MHEHFRKMQEMYLKARCNEYYRPQIEIGDKFCRIEISVKEEFFHAGGAVHGSVYFKLLDDAAYFAANSVRDDAFLLTSSFTIYMLKPVVNGRLIAEGRLLNQMGKSFLAESLIKDDEGNDVARGSGTFVLSKLTWNTKGSSHL